MSFRRLIESFALHTSDLVATFCPSEIVHGGCLHYLRQDIVPGGGIKISLIASRT